MVKYGENVNWGSFIFGILFLLAGIFTGFGILIFGPIALILLVIGLGESEPEKVQKKHLEETQKLREELQSIKGNEITQKQIAEIEHLKKEIEKLKGRKQSRSTKKEKFVWECEYCGKTFDTKKECDKHEETCLKKKVKE